MPPATPRSEPDPASLAARLPHAVRASERRIAPYALVTPLTAAPFLGDRVFLKSEHRQRTGSFKFRGALNKLLQLTAAEREAGVVTSSTGNHGLGVAEGLRVLGGRGTVVASAAAAAYKLDRMREAGLEVIVHPGDPMRAELAARELATRSGRAYVSAYNDWDVVAGQGTVGVEIARQLPDVEVVYIAVGGGGLISGVASHLRVVNPKIRIVGCWPETGAAMHASIAAGEIVAVPDLPTLSDGTAGNVEPGAITFALCRDLIDEHVLVPEREIARAMRDVLAADGVPIEGAAGVAVAGWRRLTDDDEAYLVRKSVIVVCGGNVSDATLEHARQLAG